MSIALRLEGQFPPEFPRSVPVFVRDKVLDQTLSQLQLKAKQANLPYYVFAIATLQSLPGYPDLHEFYDAIAFRNKVHPRLKENKDPATACPIKAIHYFAIPLIACENAEASPFPPSCYLVDHPHLDDKITRYLFSAVNFHADISAETRAQRKKIVAHVVLFLQAVINEHGGSQELATECFRWYNCLETPPQTD